MARQVANVDIITDSFEIWLLETNELLHALSTEVMTANTTYANTGNSTISRTSQLWGTFGANNLVVSNWVRGGNVNGLFANLQISTNTIVHNTAAANIQLLVGNSSSNSYLNPIGVYLGLGSANTVVNTSSIITQSSGTVNTNITPTRIQVANSTSTANVTAISFQTGLFLANTLQVAVGANVVANASAVFVGNSTLNATMTSTTLSIGNTTVNTFIYADNTTSYIDHDGYLRVGGNADFANTMSVVGNVAFSNTLAVTGNVTLSNTLLVTGAANLQSTLGVVRATTLANTLAVTGNTVLSNTLAVTGNTTLSNTLSVSGAATFGNSISVSGNTNLSDYVTFDQDYAIQVDSILDVGSNTTAPIVVYQFPKTIFSSAKLTIQVKNSGNTQISEAVLAHDGTDAYVTVYATVASPGFANSSVNPLGTFSANVLTSNVQLLFNQSVANSSVKIVAHLIK